MTRYVNTTKEDTIDNIAQLSIVDKYTDVELWHPRFGHLRMDGLKQLQTRNLVRGFDLKKLNDLSLYTNCFQRKQHINKFSKQGGVSTFKFLWTHVSNFNWRS